MSGVFGLSDVRTEQIDRTWPEFTNYGYFVGGASPTGYAESRIDRLEIATETISQPPNNSQYTAAQAISDTVEAFSPEYGYLAGGDTRGGSPAAISHIRRIDFSHELDGVAGITQIPATLPANQDNMASISTPQYAYFGGGAAPYVCNIHRLEFSSETMSTDASNLTQNRGFLAGVSGSQYGYFCGGFSTPPPTRHSTIDRMDFSTETGSVPPVVDQLTVGRSHVNSFESSEHGYIVGGLTPVVCTVDRLDFSSETVAATTGVPEIIAAGTDFSVKEYGYIGGNGPGAKSTIYRFEFSSETFSAPGAVLSSVRGYGSGVRDSGHIKPNSLKGTDVDGVPISSTYGYFAGGLSPSVTTTTIDRINYSDETVSVPSPDLTQARSALAAVSNFNYGYFGGGTNPPGVCTIDRIDFTNETVAVPPVGNQLTQARSSLAAVSNSNYGYFGGGSAPGSVCTIDRLDFSNETVSEPSSNLTQARYTLTAVSNSNYGYFAGGNAPPQVCTIDRLDFSSETVSEPSSNLTQARYNLAAVSNSNYGYFAGGNPPFYVCTIDRLDFSNESVAVPPVGNQLTQDRTAIGAVSNSNYGYFGGGAGDSPNVCIIDRLDFSSETTSAPSSNLTQARRWISGVSN